jgi:hypothetical protein
LPKNHRLARLVHFLTSGFGISPTQSGGKGEKMSANDNTEYLRKLAQQQQQLEAIRIAAQLAPIRHTVNETGIRKSDEAIRAMPGKERDR